MRTVNYPTVLAEVINKQNNFGIIRLICALLIIIFHSAPVLYNNTGIDPISNLTHSIVSSKDFGLIGLSSFFFISGLLISFSYEKSTTIFSYLIKRALRIFPGLVLAIALIVFVLGPLITTLSFHDYLGSPRTWSYLLNATLLRLQHDLPGVFENNPIRFDVNGVIWSLSLEFICYLIVVGVAIVGKYFKIKRIAILCGLAFICLFLNYQIDGNNIIYNGIPLRMISPMLFFFISGMIYFDLRHLIAIKPIVAITCIFLLVATKNTQVYDLAFKLAFPYLIIFSASLANSTLTKISSLGDFSYGVYLSGFAIQQTIVYFFRGSIDYKLFVFLSCSLAIVYGILSWHLLEKRMLRFKTTSL